MLFLGVCLAILFFLILLSASIGGTTKGPSEVLQAVAARFLPVESDPFVMSIVWHLRLPRVFLGIAAGIGLAISGAAMQGVTRNPLVSPFTVGISSAAAFGASMAIMFGVGYAGTGTYIIILSAFAAALGCALLVFGLTRLKRPSPETLVLAGIALTYFFGSLTAILQFFANEQQLNAMVNWTFGTLSGADWDKVAIVFAVLLLCVPFLIRISWDLNAMFSGGEETARSLGINTSRVRTLALLISSLISASIICFTGIIGFVGLVAPHLARMAIGEDHRFLLPGSCLVGAILMVGADIVGRTAMDPIILPIGIVISFVGVPMFLYLMMTRDTHWA
ncbi:MAG: iron ABC transporter permease [Methanotrichaceae archaeon]|nr:iron ABC transporter permease [Methanotrichaceae archaeon]